MCMAVEAIRQRKTVNELTAEYGVHATQIGVWKQQALAAIPTAFSGKRLQEQASQQGQMDELHRQIGLLVAERVQTSGRSGWIRKTWRSVFANNVIYWA